MDDDNHEAPEPRAVDAAQREKLAAYRELAANADRAEAIREANLAAAAANIL
jgi:hypothetical protein